MKNNTIYSVYCDNASIAVCQLKSDGKTIEVTRSASGAAWLGTLAAWHSEQAGEIIVEGSSGGWNSAANILQSAGLEATIAEKSTQAIDLMMGNQDIDFVNPQADKPFGKTEKYAAALGWAYIRHTQAQSK